MKKISLEKEVLVRDLNFDFNTSSKIPLNLFQTYTTRDKVPQIVFDNVAKFAPEYKYQFFGDKECREFLRKYFIPEILQKFDEFEGAHKADLFRYCVLYLYGGVYLDIKTVLIRPLKEVFDHENDNFSFYSVLSINDNTIYQGILAVKPLSKIMLHNINFMINTSKQSAKNKYIIFTEYLFRDLKRMTIDETVKQGANVIKAGEGNYYLYREKCCNQDNCPMAAKDRYGLNCNVYDLNGSMMFKTRFEDFPWK